MKQIAVSVIFILSIWGLIFLAEAFVFQQSNPAKWTEFSRFGFIFFCGVGSVIGAMILDTVILESIREKKKY